MGMSMSERMAFEKTINDLTKRIEALEKQVAEKRGPGRPPKEKNESAAAE